MQHNSSNLIDIFMENNGLSIQETAELYSLFIVELDSELEELRALLLNSDYEASQKIVHNIKGISSNYLVDSVYLMAKEIDYSLKSKIYENVDLKINSLVNEAINIKNSIISSFRNKGITLEV